MKLWGGRFTKETDQMVYEFQSSINFDKRLYAQDIAGSIAHVTMLAKQQILTESERDAIITGLTSIKNDIDSGKLIIDQAQEYIQKAGLQSVIFHDVLPNPHSEDCEKGALIAQKEKVDAVVAIGGGSSMDTAKAISALTANPGSIHTLFYPNTVPQKGLPHLHPAFLFPSLPHSG